MKEQLEKIRQEALGALDGVKDAGELDALRVRFLGKKGELTGVLKMMGKLSAEERPVMGQVANNVRAAIEEKIETVRTELKEKALEARLEAEAIDVTIPGTPVQLGHRHPMNKALDEAKDIFISMGFKIRGFRVHRHLEHPLPQHFPWSWAQAAPGTTMAALLPGVTMVPVAVVAGWIWERAAGPRPRSAASSSQGEL